MLLAQLTTIKNRLRISDATDDTLLTNLIVVLLMRMLERKVRVPGFIGSAPQGTGGH